MNKDSVDRIRSATFAIARRGYQKREVERYLNQLADWLETGGGDEARSDLVRGELERIGEQTSAILTQAHDAAEEIRSQCERDIRQRLADANMKAESMRSTADEYAQETREEADAYARKTRSDADAYAERTRIEADQYGEETRGAAESYAGQLHEQAEAEGADTVEKARAEAARVTAEGERRKAELESMIEDLGRRRDAIVGQLERLANEVAGIGAQQATPHGSPSDDGADDADASPATAAQPSESPR